MKKYWIALLLMFAFPSFGMGNAVQISNLKVEKNDNGFSTIKGIAQNTSNKTITSVIITYALYKDGIKTQETPAVANQLLGNEKWQFEAMAVKPYDNIKLQSITYQ